MENSSSGPAVSGALVTTPHVLRLAVAAYLARFKGQSRVHTESDQRGCLVWCQLRGLDPLAAESPTLGLSQLQFEALLSSANQSTNPHDFALVTMLGLLGLRIFEATGSDIDDLGEEHGHRILRVHGKGDKTVLTPLPPAVGRAIDRSIGDRIGGPILLTGRGTRMDRHCASRRLRRLSEQAGGQAAPDASPHA